MHRYEVLYKDHAGLNYGCLTDGTCVYIERLKPVMVSDILNVHGEAVFVDSVIRKGPDWMLCVTPIGPAC
jgi:hypothetical protein